MMFIASIAQVECTGMLNILDRSKEYIQIKMDRDINRHIVPDVDAPPGYSSEYETIVPDINRENFVGDNTQTTTEQNSQSIFSSFNLTPNFDFSKSFSPFANTSESSKYNKISERQYTGGETLDEPVIETLKRDLYLIAKRIAIVVWPMQISSLAARNQENLINFAISHGVALPESISNRRVLVSENDDNDGGLEQNASLEEQLLKDNLSWDLWGPLIFSLTYSVALGLSASNKQTNLVFSGTFTMLWCFYFVIGLNIQLLGGNISFMSAISAAGYSLFPIVIGALLSTLLIKWVLLRLPLMVFLCIWSVYSAFLSLKCSGVLPGRVFLSIYPVTLMYCALSWLCIIT